MACADDARVTPEVRPARRTGVVPTGPVGVIFIQLALEMSAFSAVTLAQAILRKNRAVCQGASITAGLG